MPPQFASSPLRQLRELNESLLLAKWPVAPLMLQLGERARDGAYATLDARCEGYCADQIDACVAWALEQDEATRARIVQRAHHVLRTADPLEDRSLKFHAMVENHDRWAESWRPLVPDGRLPAILDRFLMWQTMWHLLAAGMALTDIVEVIRAGRGEQVVLPQTPRLVTAPVSPAAPERHPQTGADGTTTQGLQQAAAIDVARAVLRATARNMVDEPARLMGRIRVAWADGKRTRAAEAATTHARVQAARAVRETSDPKPTPSPGAAATTTPVSRKIDGRALHGSVFGTWLMLVVLSWVSLIWGAILSAPIGIGFGIMASAVAGVFVVPLWATFWGFVGMRFAHDRTLKQMGFEDVGPDTGLAKVTAAYAAELGLPPPRVGTVPAFNAFAIGMDRANATVAIGKPLLDKLTDAELRAVIGHELGHIASGDMRRMMLCRTFQNATVWFGLAQGVKQFARWVICWAAELAILAFSRKREYWADAVGATLAGTDAMIGALRKLDAAPPMTSAENTHARFMFRGKALSTHPSMEQRIAVLEEGTYVGRLPKTLSASGVGAGRPS